MPLHCGFTEGIYIHIRANSHKMGNDQERFERDIVKFVCYMAFAKESQES